MYILVRACAGCKEKKKVSHSGIFLSRCFAFADFETHSIRRLHGDANTNTRDRTCSEECPETVGGHTGGRDEVVFAQVV